MLVPFLVFMPLINLFDLFPIVNLFLLIFLILSVRHHQAITRASIEELKSQYRDAVDRISHIEIGNPPVKPSANQATKSEAEIVPLDEQNPWQIPNDVKVEIEGGDTIAPLGYEVTNATSKS